MIAFVTTIGEKTTDLCVWALKRNGFEVHTISGETTLAEKLKEIYNEAYFIDQDFIRVDADTIVNRSFTEEAISKADQPYVWWWQFRTYDWYKQELTHGGVQLVKAQAIPALLRNVDRVLKDVRPETELTRIKEFYEPRRFATNELLAGMTNYKNDMARVKQTKAERNQLDLYDWDLAERLEHL